MPNAISDYEMYLYMSFIPNFSEASLDWFIPDHIDEFDMGVDDEAWWIAEGVETFKKAILNEIASTRDGATHVVYLSGGLDSRIILGGLLESLPTSQIVVATYGIPGSWDFEIGSAIARRLGLRHEVFDLTKEKWNLDELVKAGKRLKEPISVNQAYVRQKITNHFGRNCVYWSGFMGDVLAGALMPKIPNTDKRRAILLLLELMITENYRDQAFLNQIIDRVIAEFPWDDIALSNFTLDQQLMIGLRQMQLTRPIVLIDGFTFKTPFLNEHWVNFSMNIPYKWLIGKHLYKEIIHAGFKELAKFPTSASFGMSVRASIYEIYLGKVIARLKPYIYRRDPYRSHPRTNYINWAESLRHKGYLQDSVYQTLQDLKKRALFDDKKIEMWWRDHLIRKADYATLLMNLSSLELLLKVGLM